MYVGVLSSVKLWQGIPWQVTSALYDPGAAVDLEVGPAISTVVYSSILMCDIMAIYHIIMMYYIIITCDMLYYSDVWYHHDHDWCVVLSRRCMMYISLDTRHDISLIQDQTYNEMMIWYDDADVMLWCIIHPHDTSTAAPDDQYHHTHDEDTDVMLWCICLIWYMSA